MERDFIEYKGIKYPVINIESLKIDKDGGIDGVNYNIADVELWEAIEDDYNDGDRLAMDIDCDIFFYCGEQLIASNPSEDEVIEYFNGVSL